MKEVCQTEPRRYIRLRNQADLVRLGNQKIVTRAKCEEGAEKDEAGRFGRSVPLLSLLSRQQVCAAGDS